MASTKRTRINQVLPSTRAQQIKVSHNKNSTSEDFYGLKTKGTYEGVL